MTLGDTAPNIAIYCDFENLAIGARDANYEDFDINLVIERLLDKGNIVVKKAYADWESFKAARRKMHEAAFELIEIPHVSYSGKNSADIRLVVDALDLCYTKPHVDSFVILSGDSDFSPLVSKLRENNKFVIGMGVKAASSNLLMSNCDEYIYYDDLVREKRKTSKKKRPPKPRPSSDAPQAKSASEETGSKDDAMELILDTVEAIFRERDENVYGSMIKQTIKRKKPQFSETFYGYRSFNELLEDARDRGLLEMQKDEKSGGYIVYGFGPNA